MNLSELAAELIAFRYEQGLSQSDVTNAGFKGVAAFEAHTPENPGIITVQRYAEAIGVHIEFKLLPLLPAR